MFRIVYTFQVLISLVGKDVVMSLDSNFISDRSERRRLPLERFQNELAAQAPVPNGNLAITNPRRILAVTGSFGNRIELYNDNNFHYGFPLWVGTPPQSFYMNLDTGSSDIWVPSVDCRSPALCKSTNKFNSSASLTLRQPVGAQTFNLGYKVGGISGLRRMDTVYIGNMIITNQIFGEAQYEPVDSFNYPFDGTCGFGFSGVSATDQMSTPLDNLFNQGQITQRVFCIKLNPLEMKPGGELFIGGCNVQAQYWKPITVAGFWQTRMTRLSMTINGVSSLNLCTQGCQALFDTGMALIGGPPDHLDAIAARVGAVYNPDNFSYMLACNIPNLPNIEFLFDEVRVILTPNDYIAQYGGPNQCRIGFTRMDQKYYSADYLLGDPFLRKCTIIYDKDNSRIGFAEIQ